MKKVILYSKDYCPYCVHAKRLLEQKGVGYEEINMENRPEEMQALIAKTGMRTVPQIFIEEELIGGFSELSALEAEGQLDAKLGI
tara:strand:- start:8593 stop:8847 length:255 start_codon:yes stop_codon:yes gene_type:complete